MIPADTQPQLWGYLSGIAKRLSIPMLAIGGIENHAHLLFALPPTLNLSYAVKELKGGSSRWMQEKGVSFEWQEGYSAFSVSPPAASAVKRYIAAQREHHRKRSFEEEFSELLSKCGVKLDVR